MQFGRKSEKLDRPIEQLELDELEASRAPAAACFLCPDGRDGEPRAGPDRLTQAIPGHGP
jgi:hypothetical protein